MATVSYPDPIESNSNEAANPDICEQSHETSTHGQILKSSALVGGSSIVNIVIGIVRTKAMALLLGPAGFGLFGIYNSIANIVQTVAGMGVNSSGVRQISDSVSSNDDHDLAQTVITLRYASFFLGVLGALATIIFSRQLSRITFGNDGHVIDIKILSVAIFLMIVSLGQGALIQGMRRIADLAKMNTLSALLSTLFSIPVVYFLRERGIAVALVIVAAMTLGTSWWFSHRIRLTSTAIDVLVITREAKTLLGLGIAFMSSALMTMGIAYLVRMMLLRKAGFEATGMYQAAWTLGGLYVGFILQAMGADFYPRLTASIQQHRVCNRLVNEQTEIGVLLAGPGVIGTITFAQVVISLFYSHKFLAAVPILRWLSLGMFLQVITWPIGFIVIAKARQKLFVACEVSWALVSLILAQVCIGAFGVVGAGLAFFGSYIFHGAMIYAVGHNLTGFSWSKQNTQYISLYAVIIAAAFLSFYVLSPLLALGLGVMVFVSTCFYSVRVLLRLVPFDKEHPVIVRVLGLLSKRLKHS